jgi:hypothetical protein
MKYNDLIALHIIFYIEKVINERVHIVLHWKTESSIHFGTVFFLSKCDTYYAMKDIFYICGLLGYMRLTRLYD